MSRLVFTAAIALSAAVIASCSGSIDGLTDEERTFVREMRLSPATAPDYSNRVRILPGAITLGQALFFDPDISGAMGPQNTQQIKLGDGGSEPGLLSCADCHSPSAYFSDARSTPNNVSLGAGFTTRNSPPLVNVGFYQQDQRDPQQKTWFGWDGQSDSLWMQCAVAYQSPKAMGGGDGLRLARALHFKYRSDFDALFPDAGADDPRLEPMAFGADCYAPAAGGALGDDCKATLDLLVADASKAIAAYLSKLVSVDSPFDHFAAGDDTALDDAQLRGLKLFLGQAGCITCHRGPGLTDEDFHNTGVAQSGPEVPDSDNGRLGGITKLAASAYNVLGPFSDLPSDMLASLKASGYPGGPVPSNNGQFRTKSLRNVAQTGPYMHAGQKQTLADVVNFYNVGGDPGGFSGTRDVLMQPLGLSSDDVSDLVSFLQSLTGTPVGVVSGGCLACDNSCGPYEAYPGSTQVHPSVPRCPSSCLTPCGATP